MNKKRNKNRSSLFSFVKLVPLLFISVTYSVNADPFLNPSDGTLSSTNQELSYFAGGSAVTNWWFYVGSEPLAFDIYHSGLLGPADGSVVVASLPLSNIYVTLWYNVGGTWFNSQHSFGVGEAEDCPAAVSEIYTRSLADPNFTEEGSDNSPEFCFRRFVRTDPFPVQVQLSLHSGYDIVSDSFLLGHAHRYFYQLAESTPIWGLLSSAEARGCSVAFNCVGFVTEGP